MVLMLVGHFESNQTRKLEMWMALVMMGLVGWLLSSVSKRHGLGPHMGYLIMLLGAVYWYIAPAFALSFRTDVQVTERHGLRLRSDSVGTACIYIAAYVLFSVASYWYFYPQAAKKIPQRSVERPNGLFYPLIFGLFLAGFVPYMLFGGGMENILRALQAARATEAPWKSGPLGDYRSALYYISRSGMVGAAGFAGSWAILKRSPFRTILLTMFGFTSVLMFVDGGTRSWVALAVVPTAVAWAASRLRDRVTISAVVTVILAVCAMQFAFEFARASRMMGWNMKALKSIDPIRREFDNDFFSELVVAIDLVPARHAYFGPADVWAFFSHPVPRFVWPDKPISPLLAYYNETVAEGLMARANKLPSSIGQFHMSFGPAGVALLGFLSGWVSAKASAMLLSNQVRISHLGGAVATWWFLMGRGVYPAWSYAAIFAFTISILGFGSIISRRRESPAPVATASV